MRHNPYVEVIRLHEDLIWTKRPTPDPSPIQAFVGECPLVMDVGCGSGNFIVEAARLNPQTRFIGVELKYKRLVRAAEKTKKRGLTNLRFLQAPAESLGEWIAGETADRIHVQFPDPWPKKKHRKKRMLNETGMRSFLLLLKPGGTLRFKTDHREYFEEVVERNGKDPAWIVGRIDPDSPLAETDPDSPSPTEFESLFRARTRPIRLAEWIKRPLSAAGSD